VQSHQQNAKFMKKSPVNPRLVVWAITAAVMVYILVLAYQNRS